jgi:hypothetical protein
MPQTYQVPAVFKAIDRMTKPIQKMATSVKGFGNKINNTMARANRAFRSMTPRIGGLTSQLLALGGVAGALQIAQKFIGITKEVNNTRIAVSRLTGAMGPELDKQTAKALGLAKTFDQDVNEVIESTNALAKGMGISFDEASQVISKGMVAGANQTGELLEITKEYPALMKQAGLSADAFVGIVNQGVKQGIFSDKSVDAIKEADIRLREMTPATQSALDAIGISSKGLMKALEDGSMSTFDAMQLVSAKLDKLPDNSAKVGTAIADIFGGPGEDAGLAYLRMLKDIDQKTGNLTDGLTEQQKGQMELLNANTALQESYTGLFKDSNGELIRLKASVIQFIATTLKQWTPRILEIVKSTRKWITENQGLIRTGAKVVGVLFAIFSAARIFLKVAGFIKTVISVAKKFAFVIKLIRGVATAARVLMTVLAANPIGLIITGVIALILGIREMVRNWDTWGEKVSFLLGPLGMIVGIVKNLIDRWGEVRAAFESEGLWGAIKKIGQIIWESIIGRIRKMREMLIASWEFVKGGFTSVWDKFGGKIKWVGAQILKFLFMPIRGTLILLSKLPIVGDKIKGGLKEFDRLTGITALEGGDNKSPGQKIGEFIANREFRDKEGNVINPANLSREEIKQRIEEYKRGELTVTVKDPGNKAEVGGNTNGVADVNVEQTGGF